MSNAMPARSSPVLPEPVLQGDHHILPGLHSCCLSQTTSPRVLLLTASLLIDLSPLYLWLPSEGWVKKYLSRP